MLDQDFSSPPAARLKIKRWQIIVLVVFLGLLVRIWAAWQLPIDIDEPTYLKAGQAYAQLIKSGNIQGLIDYQFNQEHPPLVKLTYSLPYLFIEPKFGSTTEFYIDRAFSVFWGSLAVLVLALIDPLAGFFLAMDSMVIKYTSETYLEALPLFFAVLAVYTLRRSFQKPGNNRWFWLAAIALGIAISGKYLYGLVGFALLAQFLIFKKYRVKDIVLFFLAACLTFWAFDPHLWTDPVNRLFGSLTFHLNYTQGADVLLVNYPWYQPLNWITASVPWHPNVFFFPTLDLVIFILTLAGLVFEWRKFIWVAAWIGTNFLTLLAWPTKWPQYTLILIPALCLAASFGLRWLIVWFRKFEDYWQVVETLFPRPSKLFWGGLIIFFSLLGFGKLGYEIQRAQGRIGWVNVQAELSPLISNNVNDIVATEDGTMALATDGGIAFWKPSEQAPWGDEPTIFNTQNSGLADSQANVLLPGSGSSWWIGTQNGLNLYDPASGWKTWHGKDMGLTSSQVKTLQKDEQGNLWVGTSNGVAVLDSNGQWKTMTTQNSALGNDAIFSIAIQPGQAVWFGHLKGVSRLDLQTGQWTQFDLSRFGFGWGGTVELMVDRQNRVWAATIGSGLNMWDGSEWTNYRASNSGIPQNSVNQILEAPDGMLWVGCSYPTAPGGVIASFNGKDWTQFDSTMSGFSGGEPLAFALDGNGKLWIGTRGKGIDIYQTSP